MLEFEFKHRPAYFMHTRATQQKRARGGFSSGKRCCGARSCRGSALVCVYISSSKFQPARQSSANACCFSRQIHVSEITDMYLSQAREACLRVEEERFAAGVGHAAPACLGRVGPRALLRRRVVPVRATVVLEVGGHVGRQLGGCGPRCCACLVVEPIVPAHALAA